MKNIFSIALIALFFVACGETENKMSDPNVVAESFLKDYVTMNYEGAKKYASKEFKGELDRFQDESTSLTQDAIDEHKSATPTIKGREIKEAEGLAIVKYATSHFPEIINQLELIKVEENWYVNNVENTIDIELDEKFSEEEIKEIMNEAEEQEEIIPTSGEE